MKENYITKMPDKAGAFMKASEVISNNGGNITRVSYNKAVDAHTLFIEVDADGDNLKIITDKLSRLGYLVGIDANDKIIVVEFILRDVAGAVLPVLKILQNHDVNISYINSRQNGSDYQFFKMGLLIDDADTVKELLNEVSQICDIRILDYDATERPLDNTVFYIDFANEIRRLLSLNRKQTNSVIIHSNRIMQLLDDKNEAPLKTFEYIRQFATFIAEHKGENYRPVINCKQITKTTALYSIEPPCGSNSYVFTGDNELLFIDCGFACFRNEILETLRRTFPNYDTMHKRIVITHGDIDHSGLLDLFDEVYLSKSCYENFYLEHLGRDNYREQNVFHSPYCSLSKILTEYVPPALNKLKIIGEKTDDAVMSHIGVLKFGDLLLDIYESNGGHVKGETVIVCKNEKIMFTGDCLVNINGFSAEQHTFNSLAPYLMQSVNVDSRKATVCRQYILKISDGYLICPGHGSWFVNQLNNN